MSDIVRVVLYLAGTGLMGAACVLGLWPFPLPAGQKLGFWDPRMGLAIACAIVGSFLTATAHPKWTFGSRLTVMLIASLLACVFFRVARGFLFRT